ncbi:hypothetical protein I6D34_11230 [Staphylococcus aureus]|nr:hypothetical protein [Staphylococcus aureus]MBH4791737.1 hypothetical protein [Staphylococcus aureus]MBH4796796.1 hypothetical protein [Staphylococcus aureus]MBH4819841.1 hypothetical protein [Staphylococcus aureus]MBH4824950.1 hypothetical protein [Staphylococcus aureus]
MAEIVDLEWLKYKKEFIENDGIIDHSKFINSIHFHKSYSTEILNIINCLFKKTEEFSQITLHSLLLEIKNAEVKQEVKNMINKLYSFDNVALKEREMKMVKPKNYSSEFECIQVSFPPQVLKFFKALLESPNMMNEMDVIAIIGIIKETKISIELNEYIDLLIDLNHIHDESDMERFFDDGKRIYQESLFKKYIH